MHPSDMSPLHVSCQPGGNTAVGCCILLGGGGGCAPAAAAVAAPPLTRGLAAAAARSGGCACVCARGPLAGKQTLYLLWCVWEGGGLRWLLRLLISACPHIAV